MRATALKANGSSRCVEKKRECISEITILSREMVSTPTARSATCSSFGDLSATSSSAGTPTTRKMRASGKPSLERVKVHCRLRPFLGPEEEIGGADSVVRKLSAKRAGTPKDSEDPPPDVVALRNETFQFDSFLGAQTSQETVYERVAAPIVSSVLQGYNGTVFAYGQTGSGKTFSMFGGKSSKEAGIVPRALVHIFKEINEDEASEYSVTLSYVQLYCELLTDLLSPNGPEDGSSDGVGAGVGGGPTSTGPGGHKSLLIREDTKRGIFIEGVKCAAVESAEEAMAMIQEGDEHRVRAATNMNAASSRSHACIILNITKRKCAESAQAGGKKSKVKFGKLILVDLAGSERVKKALGDNHSHHGTRFMESKAINLSLSALGNCISALAQRKQHIPYRDAKLTRLLKDSLGGNSMTALVLNVAPHESFASETKSTLTFGQRAMAVQTRVTINEQVDFQALYSSVQASLDHKDDRIHELEIALSKVRIELNDARQQADKAEQERSMASMQLSSLSVSADVADQVDLLQAEHARAVEALRNEFESKISAEKQRASSAQEEWHRIEYELKDEREEHLRTCALLREKQAQLAEVEQSKEDRIAELFEDLKASQERSDAARAETEAVEAERVRLAAENASMRAELDKGREFQERGLQLMETLTSRVESLEERKRRAQEPETGSQSPSLHSSRRLESEGRHESRASRQARHISSLTKPKRHPSRIAPEVPVVPRNNISSTSRTSQRSGGAHTMMTSSSNNNNNNNNNNKHEHADDDDSATDRYSARTNGSSDSARRWRRSSSAASTGVGLGRRGSGAGGGSSSSRVGSATASILRF